MSTASGEPGGRRAATESLRALASPMLAYFDKRFQEAYDRIDDRMNELYSRVATEVETMSEMTIVMQRFLDVAGAQVEDAVATIRDARASLERPSGSDVELTFAMVAVGRLPPGARILHVGTGGGLPSTLQALGYDVAMLDTPEVPVAGLDGGPFDCIIWLSAMPDRHTVELLAKSLDSGGELVMSVPSERSAVAEEVLSDWSVVEHRRPVRTNTDPGSPVELVRATPPT